MPRYQSLRWLQRLKRSLLRDYCRLCGSHCDTALCAGCLRDIGANSPSCRRCAARIAATADRCGLCLLSPPSFASALAPYDYRFPLDRLLARFKYQPDLSLWPALALLLARAPMSSMPAADAVIAVPLHRRRLASRGFNQAALLAAALARRLELPLPQQRLIRSVATPPQAVTPAAARAENVAGAFVAPFALTGQRICLVDDVFTTGATLNAASEALLVAGAREVVVFALARAGQLAQA